MKQLLLATRNRHKVVELRSLLASLPVELLTLDDFPHVENIVEDQETLEGNALKKAHDVFRLTQTPTLADDSGLEVEYLNNAPGVYSSRYAGPSATYADNCKKLLAELRGVPPRRRGAQFRCVIAVVGPHDFQMTAEGVCIGSIIEAPRGDHGFGYDPIFLPADHKQTLAEMDLSFKNKLSHRTKAIQNIHPTLLDFLSR